MKIRFFLLVFFTSLSITVYAQYADYQNTIAPHINFPRNNVPVDLDNDGDLDIFSTSSGAPGSDPYGGKMGWFKNIDGMGTFGEFHLIDKASFISNETILLDWDNDGDLDIFLTTEAADNVFYYEHIDGQGHFKNPIPFLDDFYNPYNLNIVDIDGDNDLDFVLQGDSNSGNIRWFENIDGSGTLASPITLTNDNETASVLRAVDLDEDGDLDLISGRLGGTGPKLVWYENLDGLANFSPAITINSIVGTVRSLRMADVDNDGHLDILVASESAKLTWYPNINGNASFPNEIIIDDGYFYPQDIFPADIDADGDLDIFTASGSTGRASWYENVDGIGSFGTENIIMDDNGDSVFDTHPADFNNDSRIDVLVTSTASDMLVWYKNIDNQGSPSFEHNPIIQQKSGGTAIATGDINNDGNIDIISSGYNGIYLHYNQPSANNPFSAPTVLESELSEIQLKDIDNDGDLDIIGFSSTQSEGHIGWHENMDGLGSWSTFQLLFEISDEITKMTLNDIDADNDLDIILATSFTNDGEILLLEHTTGQGDFGPATAVAPVINGLFDFTVSDVDMDGDSDILYTGTYPHQVVLLEQENAIFTPIVIMDEIISFPSFLRAADMDADNDIDIVLATEFESIYWLERTDASFNFSDPIFITGSNSPAMNILEVFDYNNDGWNDIFYSVSQLRLVENLGAGNFEAPNSLASYPRDLEAIDMNEDGDLDLVFSVTNYIITLENYSEDSHISGQIFWDQNENGIFEADELPMEQHQFQLTPNALISWATEDGYFSFPVAPNEYELSCTPIDNWRLTTDSLITVSIPNNTTNVIQNFGVKPIQDSTASHIQLASGLTRCGFTAPFWIDYSCNSFQLEDGFITLKIDTFVQFSNAVPAPAIVTDTLLTWYFDDLVPTLTQQINLEFIISGVEDIGETLHMQAIMGTTEMLSDTTSSDTLNYYSNITCAYDPNDKLVEPLFDEAINYTLWDTPVYYTVRFQNTGLDTAFNVRIEDQLSENLDWTSLRVLASSHPVEAILSQHGKMTFNFNNILLPYSTIDEIGSQGFVKYEIYPRTDLEEGTYAFNTAHIFFDFNPPIITNTVHNIFVSEFPINPTLSEPNCHDSNDGAITPTFIHPNLTYHLDGIPQTNPIISNLSAASYTFDVFTNTGQLVFNETISLNAPPPITAITDSTPEVDMSQNGTATVEAEGGIPPYTFEWNTEPPQYTMTITQLSTGIYEVTITDSNSCQHSTTVTVTSPLSTPELLYLNHFTVSPNPSPNDIIIQFQLIEPDEWLLALHTIDGQIIHQYKAQRRGNNQEEIKLEGLNKGIYTLILKNSNQKIVASKIVFIQ